MKIVKIVSFVLKLKSKSLFKKTFHDHDVLNLALLLTQDRQFQSFFDIKIISVYVDDQEKIKKKKKKKRKIIDL